MPLARSYGGHYAPRLAPRTETPPFSPGSESHKHLLVHGMRAEPCRSRCENSPLMTLQTLSLSTGVGISSAEARDGSNRVPHAWLLRPLHSAMANPPLIINPLSQRTAPRLRQLSACSGPRGPRWTLAQP